MHPCLRSDHNSARRPAFLSAAIGRGLPGLLALLVLTALPVLTAPALAQAPDEPAMQAPAAQAPAAQPVNAQAALAASSILAAEPERTLAPAPLRHILIKAVGQAATPEEAEQAALRTARLLAEKRLAALGGAAALDSTPEGLRVIGVHRFPVLGISPARAVALVELRLRGMAEPPPRNLDLPSLTVTRDTGELVIVATRPCEVIVALDSGKDAEPEILPGGGGAAFRLAPGRPLRRPLPKAPAPAPAGAAPRLRVLACTGGLNPPVNAANTDEALAKARIGRPHPAIMQGVVSECVEIQAGNATGGARSMRQKAPETPVNMSGTAGYDGGRESGLPVPAKDAP